jgi:hypothetical protein
VSPRLFWEGEVAGMVHHRSALGALVGYLVWLGLAGLHGLH